MCSASDNTSPDIETSNGADGHRVCPVCRGRTLIEIRGKLQCSRCRTICETCCEGGRG
ncbi:MAG: transposase [Planctomycetota bacterium]